MKGQLTRLLISHLKELSREPSVLFWGIAFPILMSWGLGVAFTKKTDTYDKIAVVGIGQSKIKASSKNDLIAFLANKAEKTDKENVFRFIQQNDDIQSKYDFVLSDWNKAEIMLKRGVVNLVLEPKDSSVIYHYDPVNTSGELLYHKLGELLRNKHFISKADSSPLTVKGTRYIDFLIPGLMGMGVMMSCMWGISYSLIEKRKLKLMRRMVATPMKKSNFLASVLITRVIVNIVESGVLFLFALLYFSIEVQGNAWALLSVFLAGNIAFAGIAVFVASRTSKSEVGNGMINAFVTPMMILSGVFFSYQNFPEWGIAIIKYLPMTLLADNMRAIFNEGAGFAETYKAITLLSFTGLAFFLGGLKIFKWY